MVVDDGIATGFTALAACDVARAQGARRVVLAVPVAPSQSIALVARSADEVICLRSPEPFFAVGQFYQEFSQTPDEEVVRLLQMTATRGVVAGLASRAEVSHRSVREEEVTLEAGRVRLAGHLCVPEAARALVVFAHGSGSSRHSPRNRFVATALNEVGLGTLLVDLLSPVEERDRGRVFDIEMLADRLSAVTRWLRARPEAKALRVGYFGASTGAAAALWAAGEADAEIGAVVCRGGRPDLARGRLGEVAAPTLLIVGGADQIVLDLNLEALQRLRCETSLAVVDHASHLFEEPGALEEVARLAGDWFVRHLAVPSPAGHRLPDPPAGC